jgi:FlaA1/EpsC-like NDP-sugar epimerase
MTIPEAVQLVLQAAMFATVGDTFVLDMGEQVRVDDLARDLIALHGLRVGEDVAIEYIGLRPGEKLVEELLLPGESAIETAHEAILRVPDDGRAVATLRDDTLEVEELLRRGSRSDLVDWLSRVVPEFQPTQAVQFLSARDRNP